ncbi:MAG: hypothetical protein ACP5IE_06695 [Infirmifilum sp.]
METNLEILDSLPKVSETELADEKISDVKCRVEIINDALGRSS